MSFLAISSARALSLGVVIGNSVAYCVGDEVGGVFVDGFVAGVRSSSLSYSSMIVGIDDDVAVVLLILGDGI